MLVIVGAAVTAFVYFLLRPWRLRKRLTAALLTGLVVLLAIPFASGAGWISTWTVRGTIGWWQLTPGKEFLLVAAMLAGMFVRVAWDAIDEYRRRKAAGQPVTGPVFEKWDFVMPALTAVIVFQPVLSMGEGQPMSFKLALFSMQNGFFWNTVFAKIKQSRESSIDAPHG